MADWLQADSRQAGMFRSDGVGRDQDVDFVPFYRLHRRTYAIYWDLFTPQEWENKARRICRRTETSAKLELATVAFAQPGEMQPERDFNHAGRRQRARPVMGRPSRRGSKWFSFDLPVEPAHPMALVATYYDDEWRKRTFDILVDGQQIGEQVIARRRTPLF